MTNTAKAALIADPAFPHRDFLVCPEKLGKRFSSRFGNSTGVRLEQGECLRVKYRPGVSLRFLHQYQIGERTVYLVGRTYPQRLWKTAGQLSTIQSPSPSQFIDDELNTIFYSYPHDRKIANLDILESPPKTLAKQLDGRWCKSQIIAYAPEKCVTVQCLNETDKAIAYAKLYAKIEECPFAIFNLLTQKIKTSGSPLRIPKVLDYSPLYQLIFLETVRGQRLADLTACEQLTGFALFGEAIARLHALPQPEGLRVFGRLSEKKINHTAHIISQVRPEVSEPVNRIARCLVKQSGKFKEMISVLHGDVHPKNGLMDDGKLTLIDLDQVSLGDASNDIGSFLALLRYRKIIGLLSESQEKSLANAFVDGYQSVKKLPSHQALNWHTAAALFAERAQRAICRYRSEGLFHLEKILAETEAMLRN
ncbi:MAG: phosphotransferase [Acidobacteriota bacterium]